MDALKKLQADKWPCITFADMATLGSTVAVEAAGGELLPPPRPYLIELSRVVQLSTLRAQGVHLHGVVFRHFQSLRLRACVC